MHDWTLVSIFFDWKLGRVTLELLNQKSIVVFIVADDVCMLHIPKEDEWGRSVSVNGVIGPVNLLNGKKKLQLEMQSGDVIEIIAASFVLPIP